MWFRLDFETFLATSQLENKQVLFIFSMCFDTELMNCADFKSFKNKTC